LCIFSTIFFATPGIDLSAELGSIVAVLAD